MTIRGVDLSNHNGPPAAYRGSQWYQDAAFVMSDMRPTSPAANVANRVPVNAVDLRQGNWTQGRRTNPEHVGVSQFVFPVSCPSYCSLISRRRTASPSHIGKVFLLGADLQMIRSNTRRVIAAMQHVHSFGDLPVGQFPRHAMSKLNFPVLAAAADPAVVEWSTRRQPQPAIARPINLRPESFGQRFGLSSTSLHMSLILLQIGELLAC